MDVLKEHIRSRMVYFYLVLTVCIVSAFFVLFVMKDTQRTHSSDGVEIDITKDESQWFGDLLREPVESHLKRLQAYNCHKDPDPDSEWLFPVSDHVTGAGEAGLQRCVMRDGFPVHVLELPDSTTGCIIFYSRVQSYDAVDMNVSNYCAELINHYIQKNPGRWPLLRHAAGSSMEGFWFQSCFLPAYFSAALDEILDLALKPPLNPRYDLSQVLSDIIWGLRGRNGSAMAQSRDSALDHLIPGSSLCRRSQDQVDRLRDLTEDQLTAWLNHCFSPPSMGMIVAGPFTADAVLAGLEDRLHPFLTRSRRDDSSTQPVIAPVPGVLSRTVFRLNEAGVSAAIHMDFPEDSELDYRYEPLLQRFISHWYFQMRKAGLVYVADVEGPLPQRHGVVFVLSARTSTRKEKRLMEEMQNWLGAFPQSIPDERIAGELQALSRTSLRLMDDAESAGLHLLHEYCFRDLQPKFPMDESSEWRCLTPDDVRKILNPAHLKTTSFFCSVSPGVF